MKIILFKFIIIIFLISCAPGTEKPEPSAGDSLTQDTPKYFPDVVLVYENDPITIGSVDCWVSVVPCNNPPVVDISIVLVCKIIVSITKLPYVCGCIERSAIRNIWLPQHRSSVMT